MINERQEKQNNFFKNFQFYRLNYSLSLVEKEIANNKDKPCDGSIFDFFTEIGNNNRAKNRDRLQVKKERIEKELHRFLDNNINVTIFKDWQLLPIANELFPNKDYAIEKHLFSISVIYDKEYNYEYDKESLDYVSWFVWGNNYEFSNIKNQIETIYKELAKKPMSTNQKLIIGGAALLGITTLLVAPLMFSAITSGGAILGGLASIGTAVGAPAGMAAITGIGVIGTIEVLLDCALVGFTYAVLDAHNKNQVKQSFRALNTGDAAHLLAIRCYLMRILKQVAPHNKFKEKANELLQMIQDLKSDTDYVLLIEKNNVEENKRKIEMFHNLDTVLAKTI